MSAWPPRALGVLARLSLLQAGWNYRRFQNLGWAWALAPALKALYPDKGRRLLALRRHLDLFNTHPVMASCLAGSLIKVEEDLSQGRGSEVEAIRLRDGLMAPFAALGDGFFWGALRPLAGLAGAGWAWLAPAPWAPFAPALLLLAYNPAHLGLRAWGLQRGWAKGLGVAGAVHGLGLPRLGEGLRAGAFCLAAGLALSLGRFTHPSGGQGVGLLDNFLFVGSGFLMLMLLRLRMNPLLVLGLAVAGGLMSATTGH